MNRIYTRIGLFLILLSLHTFAFAQSDPISVMKEVANQMIAGLKENKATLKSKPTVVYDLAYRYVVPHAAISQMSQQVLPPRIWKNATQEQHQQFQREFTKTLIRTYASALASYEDQSIEFYPIRGKYNRTVVVNSVIHGNSGRDIRVSYRLLRLGSQWKLFDLSVEGVSMLESFRSQFADMLSQADMQQLLQRISAHNNRQS